MEHLTILPAKNNSSLALILFGSANNTCLNRLGSNKSVIKYWRAQRSQDDLE